ncbi:hypothetical protein ACIBG7_43130 [Nonomuraea sp. NPDC050328]|uniref:hypothetical protein n=1 Tax=Nonomuraea sp. NPDC050328 TaxID=3364361 RepID=UPI0037AC9CE0
MTTPADVITIVSVRDADRPAGCLISWHGRDWIAPVAAVRDTALDLITCAAYADMLIHVTLKLGLDPDTASRFTGDLLVSQSGRCSWGHDETLTLLPVGSTKDKRGLVWIWHGRELQGVVTTQEARQMGLDWLSAAEATESDQLVAEALRTAGGLDEPRIEGLFAYLHELRSRPAT